MVKKDRIHRLAVFYFLLFYSFLTAESPYPVISSLSQNNLLFFQLIQDRDKFFSASEAGSSLPNVKIYVYKMSDGGENFFTLTSRLGTQDAFLSLNRLSHPQHILSLDSVYLSNIPGVFVHTSPESELEALIFSNRKDRLDEAEPIKLQSGTGLLSLYFFPGDKLDSTERFFFYSDQFQYPLNDFQISDVFGPRVYPISGRPSFHHGIDLAAPIGSPVKATRSGRVLETGFNEIYGHFIRIRHSDIYLSIYGHLSAISVEPGEMVSTGQIIGKVGQSGQTTGPHLHFEIQSSGKAQDPINLLSPQKIPGK